MRDDRIFEAQLTDAFGRYADLAPVMDDEVVAREAISAGQALRRTAWLPQVRVAYLFVVLALLVAAIVVAIAAGTLRTRPFLSIGRDGDIAFTVQGNDHTAAATHLMNPDGTGDHAIDTGRCPAYSRDGGTLAVVDYDTAAYLTVIGADGVPSRKVLLVEAPSTSISYALSPDGDRVAWSKPGDGLWVAPIESGPEKRIVAAPTAPGAFFDTAAWSPDGESLAFGTYVADTATGERHRTALSVVAADGSGLRLLTERPGVLGDGLSWSPDGRSMAYLGRPDDAQADAAASDVFVIGVDGTGDRNVTGTTADESMPEWSADGAALAYLTSLDGESHRLTTIRMNGPTPAGLSVFGPESEWFVWSPEGTRLLWLEVATIGTDAYRSTFHAIDRDFTQPPTTLQAVDGLIVCTPSWQRLAP